jgi:malonyl-CoA/methylmalonyl-CoA synthetase
MALSSSDDKPSSAFIWDRTNHVPRHVGANVLPNSPILSQLLRHAHYGRLAIRDLNLDVEKTYSDLLSDVLHFRNFVEARLSRSVKTALENGEEVYMGVLAAGGYEYAVAVLTVLALKAAIVPMSKSRV